MNNKYTGIAIPKYNYNDYHRSKFKTYKRKQEDERENKSRTHNHNNYQHDRTYVKKYKNG